MPQYPSEHDITGARTALDQLGRRIEWVHSYVTRDRVYCIYRVPHEAIEPTTVEKRHA